MRKNYDFSKAKGIQNPFIGKIKEPIKVRCFAKVRVKGRSIVESLEDEDLEDNNCLTFRCQLVQGHKCPHKHKSNDKQKVVVSWEGDIEQITSQENQQTLNGIIDAKTAADYIASFSKITEEDYFYDDDAQEELEVTGENILKSKAMCGYFLSRLLGDGDFETPQEKEVEALINKAASFLKKYHKLPPNMSGW